MAAFYVYRITFLDSDGNAPAYTLVEDNRAFVNEDIVDWAIRERWYHVVIREGVTTFIHAEHAGEIDAGWLWSQPLDKPIRIF